MKEFKECVQLIVSIHLFNSILHFVYHCQFIETRHVFRKSLRRPDWDPFIRENSLVKETFLRLEKSLVITI
jgi:hypothetical protein